MPLALRPTPASATLRTVLKDVPALMHVANTAKRTQQDARLNEQIEQSIALLLVILQDISVRLSDAGDYKHWWPLSPLSDEMGEPPWLSELFRLMELQRHIPALRHALIAAIAALDQDSHVRIRAAMAQLVACLHDETPLQTEGAPAPRASNRRTP